MLEEVRQEIEMNIAPLIGGIAKDLNTLLRQELALARSELRVQTNRAVGGILAFAGAIVFFLLALFLGTVGLITYLAQSFTQVPFWCLSLCTGFVFLIPAAYLFQRGKQAVEQLSIIPEKAFQSLETGVGGS